MTDIAVIGAGAAGLGAAREAMSLGLDVAVLEASRFVGGRARTDHAALSTPFDLGCHWLQGGEANPFSQTAAASGARLGRPVGGHVLHDGKSFHPGAADDAFGRFETQLVAAHRHQVEAGGPDRPVADAISPSEPWAGHFLQVLQHECAADPREVSLADPSVVQFGGSDIPVLSGYGDLIRAAAQDVPVTLDCPVTAIDIGGSGVALTTPRGTVKARTAIVSASTAVLAAERIALTPKGWPQELLSAIDAVPLGSSTKVGLRFSGSFLSDTLGALNKGARHDVFLYCRMTEPQNVFWHLGTGDGDLAIAYLGGAFSRELALAGEAAQIDWAKRQLADVLGTAVEPALLGACTTPFDRDPWIGGGYSYCRLGAGSRRAALARPIDDRVFFAGEACSADFPTTAHGAWLSGCAAVRQIAGLLH